MARIQVVAATAAALAMSLQAASMARAETLTLSFSAFSGSANPNHRMVIDKMVEDIQKASNGKVKFETYFGGTGFGQPQRQFEQVQRGVVDIAHGLFGYTPGRFPMTEIVELPFLYDAAPHHVGAHEFSEGPEIFPRLYMPKLHDLIVIFSGLDHPRSRNEFNERHRHLIPAAVSHLRAECHDYDAPAAMARLASYVRATSCRPRPSI